jgi:hypothetical protein
MQQIPQALNLLLADKGFCITHLRDLCDLYATDDEKHQAIKKNGYSVLFSGHDLGIKSKTYTDALRQNGLINILFEPSLLGLHHSIQAASIIWIFPTLLTEIKASRPGSLLILPTKLGPKPKIGRA